MLHKKEIENYFKSYQNAYFYQDQQSKSLFTFNKILKFYSFDF